MQVMIVGGPRTGEMIEARGSYMIIRDPFNAEIVPGKVYSAPETREYEFRLFHTETKDYRFLVPRGQTDEQTMEIFIQAVRIETGP
jgi:hypothetical protein